jgi:hypothetical protein
MDIWLIVICQDSGASEFEDFPQTGIIRTNDTFMINIYYEALPGYTFNPEISDGNVRINGIPGYTSRSGNIITASYYNIQKSDLEQRNMQPWTPPPNTYPQTEPPDPTDPPEPTEPREYDFEEIITAIEYQTEIQKIGIGLTVGSIIALAFVTKWRPNIDD